MVSCSWSFGDGTRIFVYSSTILLKYGNSEWLGFRKSNWKLRCSRWAKDVMNVRPLRATNCAVRRRMSLFGLF